MITKTDDQIYDDYLNTFPEEERELLCAHLKDTFGFAAYTMSVRGYELGEAIKESTRKVYNEMKSKL